MSKLFHFKADLYIEADNIDDVFVRLGNYFTWRATNAFDADEAAELIHHGTIDINPVTKQGDTP